MSLLQKIKCKIGFHNYGDWELKDKHAKLKQFCEMQQKCKTCGKLNFMKSQPHSWQDWTFVSGNSGPQVRYCNRCKKTDYRSSSQECRGNHDWGEWKSQYPNSCIQERICRNCQKKETKGQHLWTEWQHQAPDSCKQIRTCQYCQTIESKHFEFHSWGEWEYQASDSCRQVRICKRCRIKEERITHDWGEWEYQAPDSCRQTRTCKRCDAAENKDIEVHNWDEWEYQAPDSCRQTRTCKRCDAAENKDIEVHNWDEWEYQVPDSCRQTRTCKRCHKVQIKQPDEHSWGEWKDDQKCVWQERICSRCKSKEKRAIDPWTRTLLERQQVYEKLSPIQRQIMEMLDKNRSQRDIEEFVRKELQISPNYGSIGFCSCGFPTTLRFDDGSFSTIGGLAKEETINWETNYICPKCDKVITSSEV